MKKLILAILFALSLPTAAMAHSHMESSVPEDGATVTEPLEEVTLTFSAGIEEGSTITLTGADGEVGFEEISIDGTDLIGTLAGPLPDGEWTLGWNVISEDGHPIEGEITFESAAGIQADGAEEEEAVSEEQTTDEEEAGSDSAGEGEQMTEEATADEGKDLNEPEESGNVLLTVGLLVAAVILLGLIFWAVRKKK